MVDKHTAFDVATGATAALLAVPLSALLPGVPASLPGYAGVAAGVGLVVAAGSRSAHALPEAFRLRPALSVATLPVLSGLWFVRTAAVSPPADPAFLVGALSVFTVGLAFVLAHEVRLASWTEAATVVEQFTARAAPRGRRYGIYGAVAISLAGVAFLVVGLRTGDTPATVTALSLVAGGISWLPGLFAPRDVRIAEEGVRISRMYYDWDAFDGYAVGDGRIELRRRGLRPARAFDLNDVEDPDAVRRALDRFLPEVTS